MSSFADRLHYLRKSNDIRAEDLADKIGLKKRIIFAYENNEAKPSFKTLLFLADYFDVSLDYLVGRSDDPTRR